MITKIKEFGLRPESSRHISLLSISFIAHAYTYIMKQKYGYSYEFIGGYGYNTFGSVLMNRPEICRKVGDYIDNHYEIIKDCSLFKKVLEDSESAKDDILSAFEKGPEKFLALFQDPYFKYYSMLVVYNSFMRYVGNNQSKGKITEDIFKMISDSRNIIADFYPKADSLIEKALDSLALPFGISGRIASFMTLDELNAFLNTKELSSEFIDQLKKREKGYLYLFIGQGKKEYLTTDETELKEFKDLYYNIDGDLVELHGHVAFRGAKIKGTVRNLITSKIVPDDFNEGEIIVSTMTMASDLPFIEKCSAIVTDEGGILSHAAISARELKKPCIIGTKIASQLFSDGNIIEVDTEKGIVKKIK